LPGLSNFPLELPPPNVELAKPKPDPAQGKAARQSTTPPDLPVDVLAPRPAEGKRKTSR
jgi:hypothetical protein